MKKNEKISFLADLTTETDLDLLKLVNPSNPVPDEYEIDLPTKFEICDNCRGKGTTVNPAIDGNGITSSEWAEWGGDDRESYLRGDYDVSCEECDGLRVVPVVDEDKVDPRILKLYEEHQESEALARSNDRYWQRMESWGESG